MRKTITGLEADLEAKEFWLQYLPEERVLACDAKDNFWEVSSTNKNNTHIIR